MEETSKEVTPKIYNEIGFIMSTHYEIISLCLNNLSNDVLLCVTTVCKSWHHVVQSLLKKRTKFRNHFVADKKSPRKPARKDKPNVFIHNILEKLKPVRGTQACMCIAFVTDRLLNSTLSSTIPTSMPTRNRRQYIYNSVTVGFAPGCCTILAYSDGIIGSNQEPHTETDNLIEVVYKPSRAAFSAFTIPKIPGAGMYLYKVDNDPVVNGISHCRFEILKDGEYQTVTKLSRGLLNGPVKCALLFTDNMLSITEDSVTQKVYNMIKESQGEDFAYGGCVVTTTVTPKTERVAMAGGVLFCGDNLLAASLILKEADSEEEVIEKKILELKSCNFPLKNSMAFMFACVGRPDLVAETRIFQRHFPSTPLIGLVGNGELGLNFLPKYGEETGDCSKPKRRIPAVEHYYSTCIVLLSWRDS